MTPVTVADSPLDADAGLTAAAGTVDGGDGRRPAALTIEGLSKTYDPKVGPVLDGIDLEVGRGELVALLGPSGCGKSTLLRLVAGFLHAERGRITIEGRDVSRVPTHRRDVTIVHQSHALWPHLTVAENVAFGLEMRKVRRPERSRRVEEVLDVVGLAGYGRRIPGELSGGQQQRVALARALVVHPRVLLLDEPLSSLDANLRVHLREEIRRLQRDMALTTILVTHDREEAMAVSDRIVVLERGRIAQIGTPTEIYTAPVSSFVMGFTGPSVQMPATVSSRHAGRVIVDGALGHLDLPEPSDSLAGADLTPGAAVVVAVRPEELVLDPAGSGAGVDVTLEELAFLGTEVEARLRLATGERVDVRLRADRAPELSAHGGERLRLGVPPHSVRLFLP